MESQRDNVKRMSTHAQSTYIKIKNILHAEKILLWAKSNDSLGKMFIIHIRGKGLISLQKNLQKLIKVKQRSIRQIIVWTDSSERKRRAEKEVLICLKVHKEFSLLVAGSASMEMTSTGCFPSSTGKTLKVRSLLSVRLWEKWTLSTFAGGPVSEFLGSVTA